MKKRIIKVLNNGSIISILGSEGFGKNKVKSLIKLGFVYVNGNKLNKLPFNVDSGDEIVIDDSFKCDLEIIYEDDNYLVVNKPNGLLTISTSNVNKYSENTLYRMVREYLNNKHEFAFIVNRIDKETSGIVIFVKQEWLKRKLQDNWNDVVKDRKYMALVSGKITKKGRIDNYLYEDKLTVSHSTNIGGKRAITNYCPIKYNDKYTLLDINIETGRKNQIRVHMSEMKHPVVGDKKYYSKDNSFKRMMLHHYEISLINPVNNKLIIFKSSLPCEFNCLFNNN